MKESEKEKQNKLEKCKQGGGGDPA